MTLNFLTMLYMEQNELKPLLKFRNFMFTTLEANMKVYTRFGGKTKWLT